MVKDHLPRLREELALDVVLANVENASGGLGLCPKSAYELHRAGVDIMTSGNHIWKFADLHRVLEQEPWLLRPANYPEPAPGRGSGVFTLGEDLPPVFVVNVLGRTFMEPVDCPFRVVEKLMDSAPAEALVIVDVHAEATSEKRALVHMLRGRAHLVVGTHTHVQTNDACVLDGITGFITDLGMCGPADSCLGMESAVVVQKFRTGRPQRFAIAKGACMLNGALVELEEGRCRTIAAWQCMESNNREDRCVKKN